MGWGIFWGKRLEKETRWWSKGNGRTGGSEERRGKRDSPLCRLHTYPYRRLLFCGRIIMGDIWFSLSLKYMVFHKCAAKRFNHNCLAFCKQVCNEESLVHFESPPGKEMKSKVFCCRGFVTKIRFSLFQKHQASVSKT